MFLNFFNAFIVLSLAFLSLIFLSDNGFQPEINNSSEIIFNWDSLKANDWTEVKHWGKINSKTKKTFYSFSNN